MSDWIPDIIEGTVDTVTDTAGNIIDTAQHGANRVVDTAQNASNRVFDTAQNIGRQVFDVAKDTSPARPYGPLGPLNPSTANRQIINQIQDLIQSNPGKSPYDIVQSIAQQRIQGPVAAGKGGFNKDIVAYNTYANAPRPSSNPAEAPRNLPSARPLYPAPLYDSRPASTTTTRPVAAGTGAFDAVAYNTYANAPRPASTTSSRPISSPSRPPASSRTTGPMDGGNYSAPKPSPARVYDSIPRTPATPTRAPYASSGGNISKNVASPFANKSQQTAMPIARPAPKPPVRPNPIMGTRYL